MQSRRFALSVIFGTLLLGACGGGSSSGGGGGLAGTCTFSVTGDGTVHTSVKVRTSDAELAAQIQSDCRAVVKGIEIARNDCGYPLQTRHFHVVERRGELYEINRPNVEEPGVPRRELPRDVVLLAASEYMIENNISLLSCHGLGDRLDVLIK